MAILGTLESTTLDEIIRCASKWSILALTKSKIGKSQECNLRITDSAVLNKRYKPINNQYRKEDDKLV